MGDSYLPLLAEWHREQGVNAADADRKFHEEAHEALVDAGELRAEAWELFRWVDVAALAYLDEHAEDPQAKLVARRLREACEPFARRRAERDRR